MHVELESSMGDSFASLVVGTSDDPLGVTGGMQAAGMSGVANERESERVKVGEEGDDTGAGGESEQGGGSIERVAVT